MRVCVSDYVTKRLVARGRGEAQGLARGWRGEEWQGGLGAPGLDRPPIQMYFCAFPMLPFSFCVCISAENLGENYRASTEYRVAVPD